MFAQIPEYISRCPPNFCAILPRYYVNLSGYCLKSLIRTTLYHSNSHNNTLYSGCTTAKALGALVLNWPVGGLNVYAVEEAVKAGAKIIWMPTRDAANSLDFGNMEGDFFNRPGISPVGGG